jgi:hypothetical protein
VTCGSRASFESISSILARVSGAVSLPLVVHRESEHQGSDDRGSAVPGDRREQETEGRDRGERKQVDPVVATRSSSPRSAETFVPESEVKEWTPQAAEPAMTPTAAMATTTARV